MISPKQYNIIQFHAAISLVGYWFIQAIFQLLAGTVSSIISITYDAFQLCIALYVMTVCSNDFIVESQRSILKAYSIFMMLYSIRIVYDMLFGPFIGIVSELEMFMNFVMTVLHTFVSVWAMIVSRKYLDIDAIVKLVYRIGIVTVIMVILAIKFRGFGNSFMDERFEGMGGLHSLSLAKLGTIVVLASFHEMINCLERNKLKIIIYIVAIILAGWLTLISGARGALVGLVFSMAAYWLFSSKSSPIMTFVAIITVILFIVNIVSILEWLSNYFPIIGKRMLASVLENDQSNREILREKAYAIIFDNPLIGYSYRLNSDSTGYTCHNGILDIALALGIPVCAWFIYICYIKTIAVIRALMRNKYYFFAATLLIANLVSAMAGSAIDNNSFGFAIVLSASIYYYNNVKYYAR